MPKEQPTTTENLRLSEGPYDREVVRRWLTRKRDSAAAVLALGAYRTIPDAPTRLDPKSAAWRSMQSAARPLKGNERLDLETVVAIAEMWLARLDGADDETVALLSEAMVLVRSESRADSELLFRCLAPDLEDGRKQQALEIRLLRFGKLGGEARRKVPRAQVVAAVEKARLAKPEASHRQHCSAAAKTLGLSEHHVRHVVPAT